MRVWEGEVGDAASGYALSVSDFAGGSIGDSLSASSGAKFTTRDRANDPHHICDRYFGYR